VITYPPLTTIRFDISFRRTSDGTLADPTDVLFHMQYEKETPVTYRYSLAQVQRSGVGEYYVDFTPNREGQWKYAWQATGDVQASTLDTIFRVMQTPLIP